MWRKLLTFLLVAGIVVAWFGYQKYQQVFRPNVPASLNDPFLYIPSGSSYEEVVQSLHDKNFLLDTISFIFLYTQI